METLFADQCLPQPAHAVPFRPGVPAQTLSAMATADALKKPTSAYWMWLNDNRERISKELGGSRVSEVAKRASVLWKELAEPEKRVYEEKAKARKEEYERLISTEEGRKALDEKKAAASADKAAKQQVETERLQKLAAKEEKRNERLTNVALKSIQKDEQLKKPRSAYWIWLGENREKIASALGTSKGSDVAKKGGEMWKMVPEAEKAPFEEKARKEKEAYDNFIQSDEGKYALQAYKDAQQAARDQFKPPAAAAAAGADNDEDDDNKRPAEAEATGGARKKAKAA